MSETKKFYSIPEVAKTCGVSRSTLWSWVKTGHINALVTPGGHHRIPSSEIDKIMADSKNILISENEPKKILIVDDEPQILKVIKVWFKSSCWNIETAGNGFEAGVKLLTFKPHIVILDLFMPELNGFDVCRTIKSTSELSNIKVIAMTGFDTKETRDTIINLGADEYLTKPLDLGHLLKVVENLIKEE